MGLSLDDLDPPLDDIAFLARSNNRVRVLEALTTSARTRRDLHETIGVSQPTLGRILEGFRERGWVCETDSTYALTPFGRLLADEFSSVLDTADLIQQLRTLAPRLPLEEMSFDLRLLSEATVTRPTPTDASAHFRREAALLDDTERIRFLCTQAQPETVERYRNWASERGRSLQAIVAGDAIDAARADSQMRADLQGLVTSDQVAIYRYDGPVSVMLGLLDDLATIVPLDDSGVPCAFVETDHEAVRSWVVDTLDTYREASKPVTMELFAH